MRRLLLLPALLALALGFAPRPAQAVVEYVRVCTDPGAGWFYIPGTATCMNANDLKDLRHVTANLQRSLAAAVALVEAPMPSREGGFSYALHGGAFQNHVGVGLSLAHRVQLGATPVGLTVGLASAGAGSTLGRFGVFAQF